MDKPSPAKFAETLDHVGLKDLIAYKSGPEVIKLFFWLNSNEHEIFPAHKC